MMGTQSEGIDLKALSDRLIEAYSEPDDIKRLLALAGVKTGGINFGGSARVVWFRALREAARQKHVEHVMAVADRECSIEADAEPLEVVTTPVRCTVAVIAVGDELGEARRAVMRRIGALPGLAAQAVEATEPGALPEVDRFVVLVGLRTGATDRLAVAVGSPDVVALKVGQLDSEAVAQIEPPEFAAAIALQRGISLTFSSPADAANKALEALRPWWAKLTRVRPGHAPVLESWERLMLELRRPTWLQGRHGPLKTEAHLNLARSDLYVPLFADSTMAWQDADGKIQIDEHRGRLKDAPDPRPDGEDRQPATLERIVTDRRFASAVVIGEPGAGKTVLLEHIASVLAQRHLGETTLAHELDAWVERVPLPPVPVLLDASKLAAEPGIGGLARAIADEMCQQSGEAVTVEDVRAGLAARRYLLLFDALDEVPGAEARDGVVRSLEGYAATRDACPFVLTTRPMAYVGSVQFRQPLRVVRCASLDDSRVAALVTRWCGTHCGRDSYQDRFLAALAEVESRAGGRHLRSNPLLLTCTLLIFDAQRQLPNSPAALYREMVNVLCKTRGGGAEPALRRQRLETVAAAMQRAGGTAAPVETVAEALHTARPAELQTVSDARRSIDELARDTGLLRFEEHTVKGRPEMRVRPWHRSFQEYLAACSLAADERSVHCATDAFVAAGHMDDPEWTGVLRFLFGVQADRGSERVRAYLERLYHHASNAQAHAGRRLGLVAMGLTEYEENLRSHPIRSELPAVLVDRFQREGASWPLVDRLLALNALGCLGDPRLDKANLWVDVPAGSFEMGGDPKAYQSAPRHTVRLDAFRISWRPITVADYQPFVLDGYGDSRWWAAGRHKDDGEAPGDWSHQLHRLNHPVTGVSWYAAKAFCEWASVHWPLGKGQKVDLPTEAEWEYAARGPRGDIYPWGTAEPGTGDKARANYPFPGSPGTTSPVGAFPLGSRGRLVDLAGNVWEWCVDAWRNQDDTAWHLGDSPRHLGDNMRHLGDSPRHLGGSSRVVRGGSWAVNSRYLRCASRVRRHPGNRYQYLGFRVVCRVAAEHGL